MRTILPAVLVVALATAGCSKLAKGPKLSSSALGQVNLFVVAERESPTEVVLHLSDFALTNAAGLKRPLPAGSVELSAECLPGCQVLATEALVEPGEYASISMKASLGKPGGDALSLAIELVVELRKSHDLHLVWDADDAEPGAAPSLRIGETPASLPAVSLFVSNQDSDSIYVIDRQTSRVQRTIAVGASPTGLAVSPDGRLLYVTNSRSATISVLDVTHGFVQDTYRLQGSLRPEALAVSARGDQLFVANRGSASITVIDTAIGAPSGSIEVAEEPVDLIMAEYDLRPTLAVVSRRGNTLSLIDPETLRVEQTLRVAEAPEAVAVAGTELFVAKSGSNEVDSLAWPSLQLLGSDRVCLKPVDLTAAGPGRLAIACAGEGKVALVSSSSRAVIRSISVGRRPRRVAMDQALSRLYLVESSGRALVTIDLASGRVIGKTPLGRGPFELAAVGAAPVGP